MTAFLTLLFVLLLWVGVILIVWFGPVIFAFWLARKQFAAKGNALFSFCASTFAFLMASLVASFALFYLGIGLQSKDWLPVFPVIGMIGYVVFFGLAKDEILGVKST